MVLTIISVTKSKLEQSYASILLKLDRDTDYEKAMTQSILWYSWYNISDQFEYKEKNKSKWVNVVTPNGFYDELGLNYFKTNYFNSSLDRCPISISSNLATMKFVFILKENFKF